MLSHNLYALNQGLDHKVSQPALKRLQGSRVRHSGGHPAIGQEYDSQVEFGVDPAETALAGVHSEREVGHFCAQGFGLESS